MKESGSKSLLHRRSSRNAHRAGSDATAELARRPSTTKTSEPPLRRKSGQLPTPGAEQVDAKRPSSSTYFDTNNYVHALCAEEFDVTWECGPLGIALVKDLHLNLPCVRRLTGSGDSDALKHVTPGDALILINEIDVRVLTYERAMEVLSQVEKPVRLRMKKVCRKHKLAKPVTILNQEIYFILWRHKKLDLGLSFSKNSYNLPCISHITSLLLHYGIEFARRNDILMAINGSCTEDMGYEMAMEMLLGCPKPLYLTFRSVGPGSAGYDNITGLDFFYDMNGERPRKRSSLEDEEAVDRTGLRRHGLSYVVGAKHLDVEM